MRLRKVIQRNELRRYARSLAALAEDIKQAEDFATDTARDFCSIVQTAAELIAERLETAPEDKLPWVGALLGFFSQNLRYPERSRIEHIPWSVVQAMESFIQEHVGTDCNFIIRPQWRYNYSISEDYVAKYKELFDSLAPWISAADWEARVGLIATKRIYCISFPRVEKMNILTHVIWGHEVGHILGGVWEKTHFSALWTSEAPQVVSKADATKPAGLTLVQENLRKARFLDETMTLTKRALSELISDAVGAHLFGPAAVASLAEFSCRHDLDSSPAASNGYPPWRYRLRKISQYSAIDLNLVCRALWHRQLFRYIQWTQKWKAITNETSDLAVIAANPRSAEAYRIVETHWDTIWKNVLKQLPPGLRSKYDIRSRYRIVGDLIDRVGRGVPPNEYGRWPDSNAALIPDIWNASWACKVTRSASSPTEYDENLRILFHLTLKAIEASHIHRIFGPNIPRRGKA
jgi:hypothetical protein